MLKPANFDNTKVAGEFIPIILGGHHLIIKAVKEMLSKNGKEMIVVYVDTAPGDSQPGLFGQEFASDIRPAKAWPRAGRMYIVVTDDNGNCSRSFKSFVTSVEKSNPGFQTQWGENFTAQFKGKRIGGVYGEVESDWNGKISMRRELRWFISDDKVELAKIPEPKYLPNRNTVKAAPATQLAPTSALDGFVQVTKNDLDEIPF